MEPLQVNGSMAPDRRDVVPRKGPVCPGRSGVPDGFAPHNEVVSIYPPVRLSRWTRRGRVNNAHDALSGPCLVDAEEALIHARASQ